MTRRRHNNVSTNCYQQRRHRNSAGDSQQRHRADVRPRRRHRHFKETAEDNYATESPALTGLHVPWEFPKSKTADGHTQDLSSRPGGQTAVTRHGNPPCGGLHLLDESCVRSDEGLELDDIAPTCYKDGTRRLPALATQRQAAIFGEDE